MHPIKFLKNKKDICFRHLTDFYINNFHLILIWVFTVIFFIAAFILDLTYKKSISQTLLTGAVSESNQCISPVVVQYTESLKILQSFIGPLLTVLSLVLGITLTVAERSEKLVYGIRRYELEKFSQSNTYKSGKVMAWLAPVFMIICLNFQLCVSGYLLVFYSYGSLLYLYIKRNQSYSLERSQNNVINFLLHCFEDPNQPLKEELVIYEIHLESIATDAEKEGDWKSRQTLYLKFLENIQKLQPESYFILNSLFFNIVFVNIKNKSSNTAFNVLELYLWSVWKSGIDITGDDPPEDVIFTSMLYSCIHDAQEKQLIQFLEWFLDLSELTRLLWLRYEKSMSLETYHRQTVLLLIFLEEWLIINNSSDKMLRTHLETLWERGKYYFYENKLGFVDRILDISSVCMLFNEKRFLQEAKERLLSDCNGMKASMLHMLLDL